MIDFFLFCISEEVPLHLRGEKGVFVGMQGNVPIQIILDGWWRGVISSKDDFFYLLTFVSFDFGRVSLL